MIETAPGPEDFSPQALPTDPEALRVLVREVIAERDAAIARCARCARLEHLLDVARNAQYGRSSEKLDDDQLRFALEDVEQAVAALEAEEDKANPKKQRERTAAKRGNRGALPEHLPRIIETIAPSERLSLTINVRSYRARPVPAARGRCTRSARTRASALTSFLPSIG